MKKKNVIIENNWSIINNTNTMLLIGCICCIVESPLLLKALKKGSCGWGGTKPLFWPVSR